MKDSKTILTVLLFLLAILVGYVILQENQSFSNTSFLPNQTKEEKSKKEFVESLANAETVFIIMDLRNESNYTVRTNIMQCGTDFAGSLAFVGFAPESITTFALDDENCTTMNGTTSITNCLKESESGVSLVISSHVNTSYYKNKALIKIGETYKSGTCNVKESSK